MLTAVVSNPVRAGRIGLILMLAVSLMLVFNPGFYLTITLQDSSAGLLVATVVNSVLQTLTWLAGGVGVALLTASLVWRMNQSARASVVIGRRNGDDSE